MFPEWIEVFKTGKWTDSQGNTKDWTLDDLKEIVSSYKVENPAPIVIGHPETDSPAYGWVEALKIEGEKLLAKPFQLVEEFADWVKRGLYKKISVAIYPDLTLKHVGFLGGAAPAVKGLKPVAFDQKKTAWTFIFSPSPPAGDAHLHSPSPLAGEGGGEGDNNAGDNTSRSDRDDTNKKGGSTMDKFKLFLEKMKALFVEAEKGFSVDTHTDTHTDLRFTEAEVQAREAKAKKDAEALAFAEVERLKKEKEESDKKLLDIETKARKDGIGSFCEGLCKEGKLTPALRKIIEPIMVAVSSPPLSLPLRGPLGTGGGGELETGLIEFSEGVKKSALDGIKDFLTELPKAVTFREVTPKDGPAAGGSAGEKLSAMTKKKMEDKKDLSYAAAFSEVQTENPKLAEEYLKEITPKQK